MEKDDILDKGGLYTRVIIEIAGSPKEHIEKSMQSLVENIKKKSGLDVKHEDTAEAEENEKMWTTFTELEILFKRLDTLLDFIYEFMPASIEVIEPEADFPSSDGMHPLKIAVVEV